MRQIKIIPIDIDEVIENVDDLNSIFQNSACFKGMHEDIVVFYCGVCRLTDIIGEVWIRIIDKSFIETPRTITQLIDSHFNLGYERIQSIAYVTDTISHRWMLYHGFQQEGTLRLYGPNKEDVNIYSKLKEGVWLQD